VAIVIACTTNTAYEQVDGVIRREHMADTVAHSGQIYPG